MAFIYLPSSQEFGRIGMVVVKGLSLHRTFVQYSKEKKYSKCHGLQSSSTFTKVCEEVGQNSDSMQYFDTIPSF